MDYTYKFVYQQLDSELRQKIIDMWMEEGVIPREEANRRVDEVVLVGFDPNGVVCCATTVYIKDVSGDNYYFFRMFIRERDRGKLKAFKSSKLTHEYLRTYNHPMKPVGIIAIAENHKITQRIMKWEGWNYFGKDKFNRDVYYVSYEKS